MAKFAVIKTGGKQYKVSVGDVLEVEKLDVGDKKEVIFDEVLLVSDEKTTDIGAPKTKAKVTAEVIEAEMKTKKVTGVKFKAKKRYKKTFGHRQTHTKVKIKSIS